MPFSRISRFTDPSDPLHLLDTAYLVTVLPLLLIVKAPMLAFLVLVIALLLIRKKPTVLTLAGVALAGAAAIFFSLYGAFNFTGLSRLKLFVELMAYLLLLAVSLQRLTRKINFYLLISPALLLALSLFFFDSAVMLGYVVFEIFILLWLILTVRMRTTAAQSLKTAGMLFALSLPWVVVLFIFFPRISFEHASYGFRTDELRRMGHDGLMHLDSGALLVPSERIVMEVGFHYSNIPPDSKLYFRGSVLYIDKKDHWEPLSASVKRRFEPRQNAQKGMLEDERDVIAYKVSLYPTYKKWLYLLDLPIEAPTGAKIDADFQTTLPEAITEPQYYDAGSALTYRYGKATEKTVLRYALEANASADPMTYEAARILRETYPEPARRLQALWHFFADDNLTYSLRPGPLDLNRTADDFLFSKRKGYCVHFAAAFATMARMAGLPARIVTGYKADRKNSVKNYLAVKERDAHAWTEIYIDNRWQRVDPTATAKRIDSDSAALLRPRARETRLLHLNLYLLYVKYQVETWILQYSHFRQMQLFENIKKHPAFAVKFAATLLGVLLASLLVFYYLHRPACRDKTMCLLRPVLKKLQKEGYVRQEGETLHRLFSRYLCDHPDTADLQEIDRLYHLVRYGGDAKMLPELRRQIRAYLRR